MRKRLRMRRFAGGPASKFIMTDVMEGATPATMVVTDPMVTWAHGQFSDINGDPYTLYGNDQILYPYEWFMKDYSPNNPELSGTFVSNGVPFQVGVDDLPSPVDMIQFGDYLFSLTALTERNISSATRTWPSPSGWMEESNTVVTYIPLTSLSAFISGGEHVLVDMRTMTPIPSADWPTSGSLVDLSLSGINFNSLLDVEDEIYADRVYDPVSGWMIEAYVKSLDPLSEWCNVCYGAGAGFEKIPVNFLLEIPLSVLIGFNKNAEMYADYDNGYSGNKSAYSTGEADTYPNAVSGQEVMYGALSGVNKIYVNPFQLKNMYNPDYNLSTTPGREALAGIRRYQRVGKSQTLGWLCYKYIDDMSSPIALYDLIERMKGLYKFRFPHLHKSNIYSVRVSNSGLNYSIRGTPAGENFKNYIKPIIETAIIDVVKKLAPASTQFWRVIWEGK